MPFSISAILGGGIGGTSCAYFLHQYGGQSVSIDVFEWNKIGGRVATVKIGDKEFESGGTIIHPQNKYMNDFLDQLGLNKQDSTDVGRIGIFDGKEFVFLESSWSLVTFGRLLWRYGLNMIKLKWQIDDMLAKFSNIYRLQTQGNAFTSVPEMLEKMSPDFVDYAKSSIKQYLTERGFASYFIDEFVSAINIVNYGQTTDIPAFVGAVSVAGANPKLWSVYGGNKQVPQRLLEESNAQLKRVKVDLVGRNSNGTFYIGGMDENNNKEHFDNYDAVVIAFPLIRNEEKAIKLANLPSISDWYGNYHQTVATFIVGDPRASTWRMTPQDLPDGILCSNPNLFYCSVGQWLPVDWRKGDAIPKGEERSWKVFSPKPLSDEQLDELFENIKYRSQTVWLAYPQYSDRSIPKKLDFVLDDNLYYVNAIEWAASAMEMSAIGGKNVALLIKDKLLNGDVDVDKKDITKTEL